MGSLDPYTWGDRNVLCPREVPAAMRQGASETPLELCADF
jgi:hypothetical protein